jgi:hypothetical protein
MLPRCSRKELQELNNMSSFGTAVKAFFRALKDKEFAATVAAGPSVLAAPAEESMRSEALTLLASLQREARLVDFLMEPLDGYSDEQVAAAVRDIQSDSRSVLERMFDIKPLRAEIEGSEIHVPLEYDGAQFKLSGNVSGSGPYTGSLIHPGWVASKNDLPEWKGSEESAMVVAPAEVEI